MLDVEKFRRVKKFVRNNFACIIVEHENETHWGYIGVDSKTELSQVGYMRVNNIALTKIKNILWGVEALDKKAWLGFPGTFENSWDRTEQELISVVDNLSSNGELWL